MIRSYCSFLDAYYEQFDSRHQSLTEGKEDDDATMSGGANGGNGGHSNLLTLSPYQPAQSTAGASAASHNYTEPEDLSLVLEQFDPEAILTPGTYVHVRNSPWRSQSL